MQSVTKKYVTLQGALYRIYKVDERNDISFKSFKLKLL